MQKKKLLSLKRLLWLAAAFVLVFVVRYLWVSLPIITGYSAKMACSCQYLGGRSLESVQQEELGKSPLSLASLENNRADSSVTATVFGLAAKKAIFREGLGCTLVNELPEDTIRSQSVLLPAPAPGDPDTIPWPLGDRLPDSLPAGIDRQQLDAALQAAVREQHPEAPVRTRAVVVLYKGQLIGEAYAPGYDRHSRHLSWSMAKSVTSALVGVLVRMGKLDPDAPAPVPGWRSVTDGREKITLRHLLQQTSGLDFEENYSKSTDATRMLFEKADMGGYTATRELREAPGSRFYYSSGNTNILSGIIRRTLGDAGYYRFPADSLFHLIGIRSMVLEPDASGSFVGSSYAFANARDWARFGLLYLQEGQWQGRQLLPKNWVHASRTPVPVAKRGEYGYQFWLNAGVDGQPASRPFPSLPVDLFYADGYEGQFVFIIPSRELVLVRLGQSAYGNFDTEAFVNSFLNVLPDTAGRVQDTNQ